MDIHEYSTWLEIDLGAIQNNVAQLSQMSGRPVMAVVKANGYGHGMTAAAGAAIKGHAAWLAVARVEEALALRDAGITTGILVMGYTPPQRIVAAAQADIRVAVYDAEVVQAYSDQLTSSGLTLNVHLKIDSGMGRLGVFPEEGASFLCWLREQSNLSVEGLFTHFARSDEPQSPRPDSSLRVLLPCCAPLKLRACVHLWCMLQTRLPRLISQPAILIWCAAVLPFMDWRPETMWMGCLPHFDPH
jgi:alanine racemase